jgi:hypothetical protein
VNGHTPGPWTAFRMAGEDGQPLRAAAAATYVAQCIEAGGDRDFYAVSVQTEGGPDICHTGNGPTSAENARLIAAAPDLLEALKTAEWKLREMAREFNAPNFTDRYGDGDVMLGVADAAAAAIAKAEGK